MAYPRELTGEPIVPDDCQKKQDSIVSTTWNLVGSMWTILSMETQVVVSFWHVCVLPRYMSTHEMSVF